MSDSTDLIDLFRSYLFGLSGIVKTGKTSNQKFIDAELPALSVFPIRALFDGADDQTGEPHFVIQDNIGVAVTLRTTSDDLLDAAYKVWIDLIEPVLFQNAALVSNFERYVSVSRTIVTTKDGDAFFGQLRYELVTEYHKYYPPLITDAFQTVQVTVQLENDSHATIPVVGLPTATITVPQ